MVDRTCIVILVCAVLLVGLFAASRCRLECKGREFNTFVLVARDDDVCSDPAHTDALRAGEAVACSAGTPYAGACDNFTGACILQIPAESPTSRAYPGRVCSAPAYEDQIKAGTKYCVPSSAVVQGIQYAGICSRQLTGDCLVKVPSTGALTI